MHPSAYMAAPVRDGWSAAGKDCKILCMFSTGFVRTLAVFSNLPLKCTPQVLGLQLYWIRLQVLPQALVMLHEPSCSEKMCWQSKVPKAALEGTTAVML